MHDGQFFAENVSKMKPRAPAERRFLARETSIHGMHLKPLERQRLREIGLKPSPFTRSLCYTRSTFGDTREGCRTRG